MNDKLTWKRVKQNERYTEYTSAGTSYHTRFEKFLIASFRNSYTGKLESHLQVHLKGQPDYLNVVPRMYGTIPQLKAEAQRINSEEHAYRGY